MLKKILAFLGLGNGIYNVAIDPRRKYVRHPGFRAEVIVGNRVYGVRDWSLGGVAFETGADARIQAGDKVQVTMKFHLPTNDTITIEQQARIVRAAKRGVAAAFAPLPPNTRRQFERVLDSLHAQSFLESQVA
ncbi:MAG: PilZ domain-containing protein [Alphaproteobacteria bacterium]|nr:PilZ domain-containing protein [Alphaproteobacteria bacterium]